MPRLLGSTTGHDAPDICGKNMTHQIGIITMRCILITVAILGAFILCWTASADDAKKPSEDSDVAETLAKMEPSGDLKSVEQPCTASVLLYTVDAKVLGGKSAAICDINSCRIAIVGVDLTKTSSRTIKLNLRVAGKELEEEQSVKGADGEPFFESKYKNGKAQCRFHNFEFDLTDRHLGYGPLKPAGYRGMGTLWSNPSNAGVLILVDSSTGEFTAHAMRPQSKRVQLPKKKQSRDDGE